MMSSAVSGSTQHFFFFFFLSHTHTHTPNLTALSLPSPSKRGLSLMAKSWFTAGGSDSSAHTQVFLSNSTHVRETCNTGKMARSSAENIPGCWLYRWNSLQSGHKIWVLETIDFVESWLGFARETELVRNPINSTRTVAFHKSSDHLQLLYQTI